MIVNTLIAFVLSASMSVAGPTITFATKPSPPVAGDNEFQVTLTGADSKPIADADVTVLLVMPAMPSMSMPEMRTEVKLSAKGSGAYAGTGKISSAGRWNVTVTAKVQGKVVAEKKLTITAKR